MANGVIFDMDGVIVASGPAHAESWKVLARKHGIEMSDEQFRTSFGKTSRDIVRGLLGEHVSDEEIRAIDDEKEALYRELVTGDVPLTAGTREMLAALQQTGNVMTVATSGPRENVNMVLDETNIRPFFKAVVTGFDVKNGKPAPDCFLLAAERAGLEPGNCVVVEDAPVGIRAAVAAGMPAIGFVGTHPAERLQDAGAAVVIENMAELTPDLVARLLGA